MFIAQNPRNSKINSTPYFTRVFEQNETCARFVPHSPMFGQREYKVAFFEHDPHLSNFYEKSDYKGRKLVLCVQS